jgi:hypothetical protein
MQQVRRPVSAIEPLFGISARTIGFSSDSLLMWYKLV